MIRRDLYALFLYLVLVEHGVGGRCNHNPFGMIVFFAARCEAAPIPAGLGNASVTRP